MPAYSCVGREGLRVGLTTDKEADRLRTFKQRKAKHVKKRPETREEQQRDFLESISKMLEWSGQPIDHPLLKDQKRSKKSVPESKVVRQDSTKLETTVVLKKKRRRRRKRRTWNASHASEELIHAFEKTIFNTHATQEDPIHDEVVETPPARELIKFKPMHRRFYPTVIPALAKSIEQKPVEHVVVRPRPKPEKKKIVTQEEPVIVKVKPSQPKPYISKQNTHQPILITRNIKAWLIKSGLFDVE